jgi:hypothetical protein
VRGKGETSERPILQYECGSPGKQQQIDASRDEQNLLEAMAEALAGVRVRLPSFSNSCRWRQLRRRAALRPFADAGFDSGLASVDTQNRQLIDTSKPAIN